MASMRLSVLLQPEDDVGDARLQLVGLLTTMKASSISISRDAQQKWDKPYFKKTLDSWNEFHTTEILAKWQKNEYPSIERERKTLQNKLICLIKVGFGLKSAWIFANFPNLGWYCHDKRKRAGAELVVALIEWAEDAQAADPTTNLTVSRWCQTEEPPCTPAVVVCTPNGNANNATTDAHDKSHDIEPFHKAATHEKENRTIEEAQACDESQSLCDMSLPKKRSIDYLEGQGDKHRWSDFHAKRNCRASDRQIGSDAHDPSATIRHPVSEDVVGAPEHEGVATAMGTLSSSNTDEEVMPAQGADDNDMAPSPWGSSHFSPVGIILAEFISTWLIPSPSKKVEIHTWHSWHALKFVLATVGEGHPLIGTDHCYRYVDISLNNSHYLRTLQSHMPDNMAEWIATVEKERIVVGIPFCAIENDAVLIVKAPYDRSNSQLQSFVQ